MKRPLPVILFAYAAGIIGGSYFHLPSSWVLAGIMGASLGLVLFWGTKKQKASLFFAPAIFILLGILFVNRILHPDFPTHHLVHFAGDKKYNLEGVLYRPPEGIQGKTRLYVQAERIYLGEGSFPVTGKLLLTVKTWPSDLHYGDQVRFISKLYLPRAATNPGAFDYRRFLALQEVWVTAYANSPAEVVRTAEGKGNAFLHFIENGRGRLGAFLDQNAPPRSRGIIKALVLGERGDITKEVNEKFILAGVNHILSISGLHVALVAAFFFGATRLLLKLFPSLLLRWDLQKTSAWASVFPVIFYTFLAGLGVAAVRSAIMTLSFLLALVLERQKDLYDALFAAAFLILMVSPVALFDISFQLSFLSVLAILYLMPRLTEYASFFKLWPEKIPLEGEPRWKRKIWLYAGAGFLTSMAAILGTGPLAAFYFNRFSLVGFLSNLFLVPLMGFGNTLLSLLTALFIFILPPLAEVLTRLNVFLLDISLFLVDFFSRIPLAAKRVTTPTIPEFLCLYGMVILAANLRRWKRAAYGLGAVLAIFLALQVYEIYAFQLGKRLTVTFLDVGQGDAAVVRFPHGEVMVIDGGGTPDGSFDPGERILAPYLWREKIKRINYLVSTHPHPDHLLGLLFLLENFEVRRVWDNEDRQDESPLHERFIRLAGGRLEGMGRGAGAEEIGGGAKVEFIHPPLEGGRREGFEGNNASLVIRLSLGEVSFLFGGDVESAAEREILDTGALLQSAVLKVPHHGSKTSSTPEFLESVRPRFSVFTVRSGARSYLPHPAVLERYEKMGAQIYRSDKDGAITFVTDGHDLRVGTFLKDR